MIDRIGGRRCNGALDSVLWFARCGVTSAASHLLVQSS
jgi:hypothetical protein